LSAIAQDPVLNERLMIAEPWDLGPGGYQLGAFPPGWLEWNDRFRDAQRAFWLHRQGTRGGLASRLAGSSDVFNSARRAASSSVNYITAHDGFTLRDLLSYSRRHNCANGEENRDGHAHSLSINNGVEGETDRPDVLACRARQSRALLAVLCLSLGTPMLLGGDEIGHTQRGNNNAYCQDNEISWLDWQHVDQALLEFVRQVLVLRRACPLFQTRAWWRDATGDQGVLAQWFNAQGEPMANADWHQDDAFTLALKLQCAGSQQAALMLINAGAAPADFALPAGSWCLRLDSAVSVNVGQPSPRILFPCESVPATSLWVALQSNPPNNTSEIL
jgi:glycogen operon protein